MGATAFCLLLLQLPATAILCSRLLQGPSRRPPLLPRRAAPPDPPKIERQSASLASVAAPDRLYRH
ncbi:MAG: hypothetical protein HC771_20920, partial [Synechococcales cyanobacterium CRU_2_2]|nr:hypothetical protein [Synechococcales cyanobacterium CRU_2_2]